MENSIPHVPHPVNEPILAYRPGAPETLELRKTLARMSADEVDIPVIINGREIRTGKTETIRPPHNHHHSLGKFHQAGPEEVQAAIAGSLEAWKDWSRMSASAR